MLSILTDYSLKLESCSLLDKMNVAVINNKVINNLIYEVTYSSISKLKLAWSLNLYKIRYARFTSTTQKYITSTTNKFLKTFIESLPLPYYLSIFLTKLFKINIYFQNIISQYTKIEYKKVKEG